MPRPIRKKVKLKGGGTPRTSVRIRALKWKMLELGCIVGYIKTRKDSFMIYVERGCGTRSRHGIKNIEDKGYI